MDDAAIKAGRRHSVRDQKLINDIVESAIELGADHPRIAPPPSAAPEPPVVVEADAKAIDPETLIVFGSAVKALGNGKIGGYLVLFSTDNDPDLTGEFFDANTDFGDLDTTDVLYQHGRDATLKGRVLGKGKLKKTDVGVWVEAQLKLRDEYERAIYEMVENGKLGWSSGTLPNRVTTEPVGKSVRIKSWPLGLDASLTPIPAEPRTLVVTLKSYIDSHAKTTEWSALDGAHAESSPNLEINMSDETKPTASSDLAQIMAELTAIKAQMQAAPVVKTSGVADIVETQKAPAHIDPPLNEADEQLYELKRFLNRVASDDSRKSWESHMETQRNSAANYQHQKAFDTWMRDPFNANKHAALREAQKATIIEGTASLGGNLVPVLYDNRLIGNLKEASILRVAGAFQFPVTGTNSIKVTTINRSGSAQLVGELGVPTQSEPTFGVVSFDAFAYKALYIASREAAADSRFDLMSVLMENMEWQFVQSENAHFAMGNGTTQPQGLAVAATTSVSAGSAVSLIKGDSVIDLYHALPYQYRQNGVFFAHDNIIKQLRKLRDESGASASTGNYLWQPGLQAGQPDRLLGRPLYPLNTMPSAGSVSNVLVFADPRFFWISDFAGAATEMQVLQELYAASFAIGYTGWRRFDSNLMVSEAAQGMILR